MSTVYQGAEKLPPGTRRTLGRLERMLKAVDREKLAPRHKAIIRAGIVKYADGDGIFFPDQSEWAEVAGCSRKLVIAAVSEAEGSGLLTKRSRVFTTTGKKGTSVYFLCPELWSKEPEAVRKSAETRLSILSNRVSKTTHGPCVENDTTERVVTSFGSNTPTKDEEVKPVVKDEVSNKLESSRASLDDEQSESESSTTSNPPSRPNAIDVKPSAAANSPGRLVTDGSRGGTIVPPELSNAVDNFGRYLGTIHMPGGLSFPRIIESAEDEARYIGYGGIIWRSGDTAQRALWAYLVNRTKAAA